MNWLVLTHLFSKLGPWRSRKSHKKRKTKKSRHHNMTSRRKLKGG